MARKLSEAEIEAAKTSKGGWTRAQLASWGVPWPPPHGWKKALLHGRRVGDRSHRDPARPAGTVSSGSATPLRAKRPIDMKEAMELVREMEMHLIGRGQIGLLYDCEAYMAYCGFPPVEQTADGSWTASAPSDEPTDLLDEQFADQMAKAD